MPQGDTRAALEAIEGKMAETGYKTKNGGTDKKEVKVS
jgi:hypothetical protein